MKTTVTLLILFTLFSLNTFAQDSPQWHLPGGAKARLGKGRIYEIQYSPDGTRLAVASGIGIWLYDTGDLSRGRPAHRAYVCGQKRRVQPGWADARQWE